MFGFRKKNDRTKDENADEILLHSPADGEIIAIEEVGDPVFAQKMMGEGFAVIPESGLIVSPVDGKVVLTAPTAHAVGLESHGASILVHCGLDTVNLNGEGLELLVKEGQSVKAGDPIVRFDADKMKEKGVDMTTPVVITDAAGFIFEADKPKPEREPDGFSKTTESPDKDAFSSGMNRADFLLAGEVRPVFIFTELSKIENTIRPERMIRKSCPPLLLISQQNEGTLLSWNRPINC